MGHVPEDEIKGYASKLTEIVKSLHRGLCRQNALGITWDTMAYESGLSKATVGHFIARGNWVAWNLSYKNMLKLATWLDKQE